MKTIFSALTAVLTLRFRRIFGVFLTMTLLPLTATTEPLLKLVAQPVAGRITPESFEVADYQGTLQMGYDRFEYIAPGGTIRWEAWTDPAAIATVREAMQIVAEKALDNPRCDAYFADNMPGGKTFSQIWNAQGPERIQVSFSPGPSATWRAATYGNSAPYEWTITEATVLLGPESIASALVHEATRTNGIGPEFQIAYGAEAACGVRSYILTRGLIQQLGWKILSH